MRELPDTTNYHLSTASS